MEDTDPAPRCIVSCGFSSATKERTPPTGVVRAVPVHSFVLVGPVAVRLVLRVMIAATGSEYMSSLGAYVVQGLGWMFQSRIFY